MTSHEILTADVLDILFDNRNKTYGAYALRKGYQNRMGIALGVMLSTVLLIAFIVSSHSEAMQQAMTDLGNRDTVVITMFKEPPPIEKPVVQATAARPIAKTEKLVNNFRIDPDVTDVPEQAQLINATIGTTQSDGPAATGVAQPPLDNTAGGSGNAPEATIAQPGFTAVEKNAEYPGGQKAWLDFLRRYLRTPEELEAGQKRTVLMRFAVGVDGSITQFEIVQSGGDAFDKEVIRVLKKMPKWEAAVQNGRKVAVMFTQPVTFMSVEE